MPTCTRLGLGFQDGYDRFKDTDSHVGRVNLLKGCDLLTITREGVAVRDEPPGILLNEL